MPGPRGPFKGVGMPGPRFLRRGGVCPGGIPEEGVDIPWGGGWYTRGVVAGSIPVRDKFSTEFICLYTILAELPE